MLDGLIRKAYEWTGERLAKSSRAYLGVSGTPVLPSEHFHSEHRDMREIASDEEYELQPELNYRDLYRVYLQISWVRACVDVTAKTATARGFVIEPTVDNPNNANRDRLLKFFARPNPEDTSMDLTRLVFEEIRKVGDHYWEIVYGPDQQPLEIWPLDAINTRIRADRHGRVTGYVSRVAAHPAVLFRPAEIVHFRDGSEVLINTMQMGRSLYGNPPLSSLKLVVSQDLYAQAHNRAFFKNGAKVRGMYSFGKATKEQVRRNRDWLERISKDPNWSQMDLTLEGEGVTYQPIGTSPKDMEFQALRKFNRDEILAVFQVPPSLISIIETGNIGSGSGETQQENFKEQVVIPLQMNVAHRINFGLIQRGFGIFDWRLRFNTPEIVGEKTQAEIDVMHVSSNLRSEPEIRAERGWNAGVTKALDPADVANRTGRTQRFVDLVRQLEIDLKIELRAQVARVAAGFTEETRKDLEEKIKSACENRPFEMRYSEARYSHLVFQRHTWPTFLKQQPELEAALTALDPEAIAAMLGENFLEIADESVKTVARQVKDPEATAAVGAAMREKLLGDARELGQHMSAQLSDAARAEIVAGIAAGESISQLRRRIERLDTYSVEVRPPGRAGFTRQRTFASIAESVARTESRRVFTEVGKAQMRESAITHVRWLGTPGAAGEKDDETNCANYIGKVYELGVVPFGGPPAHHNCRCALQPVVPT